MKKQFLISFFSVIVIAIYGQSAPKSDSTVLDIDGNVYRTVKIGEQMWMVENLKTSHYRNGDSIPCVVSGSDWESLSTGACCYYNNDEKNIPVYGRLYNFYAVRDSRNIAPIGWHIATREDWEDLKLYLSSAALAVTDTMDYVSKLIASKEFWLESQLSFAAGNQPEKNNTMGFNAMPGGYRHNSGQYKRIGIVAEWWCNYAAEGPMALSKSIWYDSPSLGTGLGFKMRGLSVRCVKD